VDQDEWYMEYEDLVEAGEIDPAKTSLSDFLEDKMGEMIDRAMDSIDYDR
jgi:hypothetical protein